MSETQLLAAIREACNLQPGVRVRRNNTGKLQDRNGRWVTFGSLGSPDLMGEVTIEVDMTLTASLANVRTIARAFHVEVKLPGKKLTPDQAAWFKEARTRGVFVAVVHSVDEALAAVDRCRRGECE